MGMLIFPHDAARTFNGEDLRSRLAVVNGVSNISDVHDGFIDFEWTISDTSEQAVASLQTGGKAINIDPENFAGVKFAFDIARAFNFPIDLVDDQYTYEVNLSAAESAPAVWRQIVAAYEHQ
jgi:hypothetical protein